NASNRNEQHDMEINSAHVVAEENVGKNSKDLFEQFDACFMPPTIFNLFLPQKKRTMRLGFGNPDWKRTYEEAENTAVVEFAKKHYQDLSERPFFNELCDFLSSGPVIAMLANCVEIGLPALVILVILSQFPCPKPPLNLIASVPFLWEENLGTPLPNFSLYSSSLDNIVSNYESSEAITGMELETFRFDIDESMEEKSLVEPEVETTLW
ncbi:hypothetical protein S83_001319, partial [Arachis hypogaea]